MLDDQLAAEGVVDELTCCLFISVSREHELAHQDAPGALQHLHLAGRQAGVLLPALEVAHHLGELEDVTAAQLLLVALEALVPLRGHLAALGRQDRQHLIHGPLVDDGPETGFLRVLARNHDGHRRLQDLDRQVLAALATDVVEFLRKHRSRTVVRVDDLVPNLEHSISSCHLIALPGGGRTGSGARTGPRRVRMRRDSGYIVPCGWTASLTEVLPVSRPPLEYLVVAPLALPPRLLGRVVGGLLGPAQRLDHVVATLLLLLGILDGLALGLGRGAFVVGSEHDWGG